MMYSGSLHGRPYRSLAVAIWASCRSRAWTSNLTSHPQRLKTPELAEVPVADDVTDTPRRLGFPIPADAEPGGSKYLELYFLRASCARIQRVWLVLASRACTCDGAKNSREQRSVFSLMARQNRDSQVASGHAFDNGVQAT